MTNFSSMSFNPSTGYEDSVAYPTTPTSEAAFRAAMQAIPDQLKDYLNNTLPYLPASTMCRQAIMNGNFNVWQRGVTTTNPAVSTFLADRFFVSYFLDGYSLPANVIHERQALTPGDIPHAAYYYRINVDGAGSGIGADTGYGIYQRIEQGVRSLCGAGKKVTVSFWARSSISGKRIGVSLSQRYGSGGSPSASENIFSDDDQIIPLTSYWTKYEVTFETNTLVGKTFGTGNDDFLQVGFQTVWGEEEATTRYGGGTPETFLGAGNIDIAQIQLNAGEIALPFQPRTFAEELALCQRYFWKTFEYSFAPGNAIGNYYGALCYIVPVSSTGFAHGVYVTFPTRMRATPTLTCYNPISNNSKWYNRNAAADSGDAATPFSEVGQGGFYLYNTQLGSDAVGHTIYLHASASAEL